MALILAPRIARAARVWAGGVHFLVQSLDRIHGHGTVLLRGTAPRFAFGVWTRHARGARGGGAVGGFGAEAGHFAEIMPRYSHRVPLS